ncbi:MAG: OsmC family peroxiredoxin [Gemmatimonadetes bacterium]|nr:OsmC family peroxiredoxin [Gemmatimonadota bacterium]
MSEYTARVSWDRKEAEPYIDNKFSRGHTWTFDGGVTVPGSSSPQVVPPPLSVEKAVDPEEALIASLSSCHMLYFLAFAAKMKFVVDGYVDDAVGVMGKNAEGRFCMTKITLRPAVRFAGDTLPTPDEIHALHEKSHSNCIIANSLETEVVVEIAGSNVTA